MAEVFAIKSKKDISTVETFILKHYGTDIAEGFKLGLNFALRIVDLRYLTIEDCVEALEYGYLEVIERKTGWRMNTDTGLRERTKKRPRRIKINNAARRILIARIKERPNDTYLFQSHAKNISKIQPISDTVFRTALREAGKTIGVKLGTHSCRKTRGYMMHLAGIPIEVICKMFGHGHPSITMRYIGLEQESIDVTYEDIEL